MSTQESFFNVKTPSSSRATKKNTGIEKYKKNGKYTGKGLRAKESMLHTTQRANDILAPRETAVGSVLNRDKMQSITLPPKLQNEKIVMIKKTKKNKPILNTEDV